MVVHNPGFAGCAPQPLGLQPNGVELVYIYIGLNSDRKHDVCTQYSLIYATLAKNILMHQKNWQEVILHRDASSHPTMVDRYVSSAHLGWCAGRLPAVCRNPIGDTYALFMHDASQLPTLEHT